MDFLNEIWRFMRVRKKFWLLPILMMMVVAVTVLMATANIALLVIDGGHRHGLVGWPGLSGLSGLLGLSGLSGSSALLGLALSAGALLAGTSFKPIESPQPYLPPNADVTCWAPERKGSARLLPSVEKMLRSTRRAEVAAPLRLATT